jgi:putative NADPH-quinone reductase
MKIVVIYAHPGLDKAKVNNVMLKHIQHEENIEVRSLFKLYPDWNIDKEAEQKAVESADRIVLQFPFYWYSMPALLKKWFDEVFEYNWAFGPEGDKLKGKELIVATTIGGPEWSYQAGEYNTFSMSEFLKPIQQTAILSKMEYRRAFRVHDAGRLGAQNDTSVLDEIGRNYLAHITDPLLDPEKKLASLNEATSKK